MPVYVPSVATPLLHTGSSADVTRNARIAHSMPGKADAPRTRTVCEVMASVHHPLSRQDLPRPMGALRPASIRTFGDGGTLSPSVR